jgi:hypothetical protein
MISMSASLQSMTLLLGAIAGISRRVRDRRHEHHAGLRDGESREIGVSAKPWEPENEVSGGSSS